MDLSFLLSLALPLTLLALTILYFSNHRRGPAKKPNSTARAGSFSELIRNSHRILEWTTELLATSPTGTVTTFMGVVTSNPSNVEHVLKNRFDNYPKGDRSTTILADFLGRGIFNSDGDHWKLQRKTASLEFNTKTIRTFILDNVHREVAGRLLPILSATAAAGEVLDLQDLLERLAFDNVCKVAFNEDPARLAGDTDEGREFAHAFEEATNLCIQRYRHPFLFSWKLQRFLGIGSEKLLKEKIATVHRFAMRVVRARKRAGAFGGLGDDLLSRFIAEADYSDEFLRDIIISFVLAGRDTTSATLTWFFWLISTRPDVKNRIMDEIRSVRSKKPNPAEPMFALEEVREMDYLHAALSETLRLYPPVPLQTRECAADDVLPDGTRVSKGRVTRECAADDVLPDGTRVSKGRVVMYSSYAMGRTERIWGKDCQEFKPERWMENGVFQPKSPFRFPVFHGGPRMCLGKDMAYIQMKAVAASVIERFEVEVVDKEKQREPDFTMILRVKGGLPVSVREKRAWPGMVAA
ncbi:Cytochrome P450 94C1 [Cocos nucifera]|uniref:Cytochrome P450 94C1 n=1 Tax=Cocos nucifera TaxID=13894 RepID=A0A8K0N1L3_COCNU|nr:Cytochrome P450 94C1 [Cocos nucifera]